jgi:hypothetical protein
MLIDDLPAGSFALFLGNLAFSFFFQFIGFLLSYLLHTSHAAKYGSRAGLGLTLIRYGYASRAAMDAATGDGGDILDDNDFLWGGGDPAPDAAPSLFRRTFMSTAPAPISDDANPGGAAISMGGVSTREWVSFLLMTIGWFLLLSSTVGFWRIKRWERSIRSSSPEAPVTRADIERDIAVRRNIEAVFGFGLGGGEATPISAREPVTPATGVSGTGVSVTVDVRRTDLSAVAETARREVQLRADLRAAGLL